MSFISKALTMGLISLAPALSGAQAASDYPNRPVKVLVGYAPGGTPDIIARTLGEKLGGLLKQSFVIDNRPGAGGTLATRQLANSSPDGYTLLVADIGQLAIAPHLLKSVGYDPVKDFAPISLAGITPMFIAANAKTTTLKTIQDLISQAKKDPGAINYGSSGVGSIHQIAMEVFKSEAHINLTHVPYKGSGQSVPALLAGQVPVLMTALPTVGPYAATGQVNLLAVTSAKRFPGTPDVPALSELFPGYDFPSEVGLLAPAGTPPEILEKLSKAVAKALDTKEMRDRFSSLGSIPVWSTPQEYAKNIRENLKKYETAVKLSGVTPN
ncbi:MAG: tripartite tricarboxylate transporter substrate binding protein [Burkholderiaceae bacterium]